MFAVILILSCLALWLFLKFGGRTVSRYLGQSTRQVIEIPEMRQMVGNINMWFDTTHNATVKDITYCSVDGYYYSVEFRDISLLEGTIRWVPHQQGSDIIQSRKLSRWGLDTVNLKVPEDFKSMYGVAIVAKGGERIKNLTYVGQDGKIFAKEYREGIVDRFFGGFIEVKGSDKLNPHQGTPCDETYS